MTPNQIIKSESSAHSERRSELDLLGMLVVIGLVFFHTAQIFAGGDFYVMNEPSSIAALVIVAFASLWGMPLMFIVAGIAIWYSLRKRTLGEFVRERTKRLLIPFVVSVPLLIPPQVYYKLKSVPTYHETYAQFFPRFFDVRFDITKFPLFIGGAPPDEFFRVSTLYFLFDLYIFTLLLLPFFSYLRSSSGRHYVERFAHFCSRSGNIFLLALPMAVTEVVLGSYYSGNWNPLAWVPFIAYGFLFAGEKRIEATLHKRWKSALVLGILAFIGWFVGLGVLYSALELDPSTDYGALSMTMRFLKGFASWFWVVAIMGWINRWQQVGTEKEREGSEIKLDSRAQSLKPSLMDRIAGYAKEARLPFYILHHTPIVLIGYYVVQWEINALIKYLVISLSALMVTVVVYDIGIRRTKLTRFLFGMRPKS